MINVLLLAAWLASGIAIAAARAAPDESRFAWAPMAAFLGPLWLIVANEQQTSQLALARNPVDANRAAAPTTQSGPETRNR